MGAEANPFGAVEHSLSSIQTAGRPWKTTALVASGVAALELVVIVIAGVTLLGKPVQQAARKHVLAPVTAKPTPKPSSPGKPAIARKETLVLILNGNGRTGAAAGAADRVRGLGYMVGGVGNANRTDYARDVIMYRPRFRGEALRLARDLKVRIVGPLDGLSRRDMLGAHVAFVVGT